MLFDQKHKKKINIIWAMLCVAIILSMVAMSVASLLI
jgi:flagellar basal body-associated protein FliL